MPNWQTILIFSDYALDKLVRVALEQRGYRITLAHDADKAYGELLRASYDLVIIDVARTAKGVEFVRRLRATPQLSRTLVLTMAAWGTGQATLALTAGADAFESKPVIPDRLVIAVERLLSVRSPAVAESIRRASASRRD